MRRVSRVVLRAARLIAGPRRAEWADAMEAEASSADSQSTAWALGCVWAAFVDRALHARWFFGMILLLPATAFYWRTAVFFSTAWFMEKGWLPDWITLGLWILSPFPIAFFFGRMRQGSSAYVALMISFILDEFVPFLIGWIRLGISPLIWFQPNSNWYKVGDSLRMSPTVGLTCDLLVWLVAMWLGTRSLRAAAN